MGVSNGKLKKKIRCWNTNDFGIVKKNRSKKENTVKTAPMYIAIKKSRTNQQELYILLPTITILSYAH
jgi:hypothetical protein